VLAERSSGEKHWGKLLLTGLLYQGRKKRNLEFSSLHMCKKAGRGTSKLAFKRPAPSVALKIFRTKSIVRKDLNNGKKRGSSETPSLNRQPPPYERLSTFETRKEVRCWPESRRGSGGPGSFSLIRGKCAPSRQAARGREGENGKVKSEFSFAGASDLRNYGENGGSSFLNPS